MNIGFFDSGLGGLFVLRHVIEKLPNYHYVFLGDTVNVPYGIKNDKEIYTLVKESLRFLFEHDCRLVILACNTASVTALRRIQDEFLPTNFPDHRVLGVIIPTIEVVLSGEAKTVAVIGTERTVHSGKYEYEFSKLDSGVNVVALATPTLVPLIENGQIREAEREAIALIQKNLLPQHPDTLVLGCTHYGLLKNALRNAFPELRILAQEEIIPEKLQDYLSKHPEIESLLARDSKREILLTKVTPAYEKAVREWIGDVPVTLRTLDA